MEGGIKWTQAQDYSPERKALGCLKITFVAEEISLEREKPFLSYMVSVSRGGRERGGGGEHIASSRLHFNSHLIHGKSTCLLEKNKRG